MEYYDQYGNALEIGTFKNGNGNLLIYDEDGTFLTVFIYKSGELEFYGL
ncbi:hypothetical protein JCM19300_1306 [Algibacter lectus]|uniref:Uncharacterized protein n=1 Tax=Algibacter lectus TaxID=221126 RepID=A0A090VIV5_9FLAO|nr:hypothetical protein JCM19300_1306 [Algibacter lectus]